jgi:hypothetical protein
VLSLSLLWFVSTLLLPMDLGTHQIPLAIDLSKATKLKDVSFPLYTPDAEWFTTTLRAVKSKNPLRRISIHFYLIRPDWTGGTVHPK